MRRKSKMFLPVVGCTCHVFDIGPRCEQCQAACAAAGHPKIDGRVNGQNHYCGVILGRAEPHQTPVSLAQDEA